MNWIESKYIGLISAKLNIFKRKSGSSYNFRCPVCGDSKKSKSKTRGWLYEKAGRMKFYCHNCNASMSFEQFIKFIDSNLYDEMKLEMLREKTSGYVAPKHTFDFKPVFKSNTDPLKYLTKISSLPINNRYRKYIDDRMIPPKYLDKIYVSDAFCNYINSLLPNKFSEEALNRDEPRIVIPFFDKNKNVHAIQGRTLNSQSTSKYITIILDETKPKIYGLDEHTDGKTYVVEGPFDAMFLDNAIAIGGSDLTNAEKFLNKDDMIIVFDNERRSKEIVSKIKKAIYFGFKVCIWPENVVYKDINDMVKLGRYSSKQIMDIIDTHTYAGLAAELELNTWKRAVL